MENSYNASGSGLNPSAANYKTNSLNEDSGLHKTCNTLDNPSSETENSKKNSWADRIEEFSSL